MPPHWLQAGPRSRPMRRAGATGGGAVGGGGGGWGAGGGPAFPAAVGGLAPAVGATAVLGPRGASGCAHDRVLRRLAGADLGREDAELLLRVGVQEAGGEPAHDVVRHRL